jgi:hypothetical protein
MAASCTGASGQTGTKYTYAQLEGLWINAGGAKALAPTMAAIAMAESGGCSAAYNPSGATGLWQILGAVNSKDQSGLYDPAVNAREAVLKYQAQGLGAWETYTSGAYKAELSSSTTPDVNVPAAATLDSATSTSAASSCAWSLKLPAVGQTCVISVTGARVLLGGSLLVVAGVLGLAAAVIIAASAFQHSGAAGAVAQAAGAFTPVGRVVSAVRS